MTDDLSHILAADVLDDVDRIVEGTLRPRRLDEYIGQTDVKNNLSILLAAARQRGGRGSRPAVRPARPGQDHARDDRRARAGREHPLHQRAGRGAARGPRRDPDGAGRARRPVHRRDPSPQPGRRGDPLSGDGGLRAGRDDRQGAVGAVAAPDAEAVHGRRRHHARRPDQRAAARPVRGDVPPGLLHRGGADGDRPALGAHPRGAAGPAGRARDRPTRSRDAAHRQPPAEARARPRPGAGRRHDRSRRGQRGDARAMDIDDEGLDVTDRKLLAAIIQKFGSGPVGVAALAAVLAEETETIEDVYEPYLLRLGFLDRTPQGRIATEAARQHLSRLGFEIPQPRRAEPEFPGFWDGAAPSEPRRGGARLSPASFGRKRSPLGATLPPSCAPGRRHGRRSPADAGARRRRDAAVHAGRHERHGQGAPSGRRQGGRRVDHPRQHLPPVPAAGPRAHRAARRPAPVHGLGPADPDRLGRLPGRVAGRPAGRRRGRRHVPQPPRRVGPPVHAGALDRGPGGARGGRRGRVRPAGDAVVAARPVVGRHGTDASLGGAVAAGPLARRTRRCSASSRAAWTRRCGRSPRGSSPRCRSTG